MHMCFLADPKTADVKFILNAWSINTIKFKEHQASNNFFICSLRHYSVLIFNFCNIKCGYKIKIYELYHKFKLSKNIRYQKNYLNLLYNSTEISVLFDVNVEK